MDFGCLGALISIVLVGLFSSLARHDGVWTEKQLLLGLCFVGVIVWVGWGPAKKQRNARVANRKVLQ